MTEFEDDGAFECGMAYVMLVLALITACALILHEAPYGRYSDYKSWFPLNDFRINPRIAWFLQESPSFLIPLIIWRQPSFTVNALLLMLFLIHYFHRTFVYSFLMHGSNKQGAFVFISAFIFCTYNGYMQSKYLLVTKYPDHWIYGWKCVIGLALFFFGMFVNIHSDYILRFLRKPGETGYKIPRGGMFNYVSGANYLGEIIEWLGYAVACWSLPAFAFAMYTISNIAPRAFHHHRWYHAKFEDYPKERKALIPFLI